MDIRSEEFENLVAAYQRLVFAACFSFTKNYFSAEDLAQETFMAAYRNLNRFDGRNPKAWLVKIAANKCKDYLKSPKNQPSGEMLDLLADARGSPEEQFLEEDAAGQVKRLCESLKEPYRLVALAYFCEEQKLSELARQTGENLKTLETRLQRAKKLLRTLWKEESREAS